MYKLIKKWKFMSLIIAVVMVLATVTAFASSEQLEKNADRFPRIYYVGEEVVFAARIENPGTEFTNTYYYIEDIFYGNTDYVTIYRDGNGDDAISFDGDDNVIVPDYELILGTDYLIEDGKIILRWIDGDGDPTYVGEGTQYQQTIPTFPGEGDATLVLGPGESSYIEMHYIVQEEDINEEFGTINNEINTLGEDTAGDTLTASVDVSLEVIRPDTAVDITASETTVLSGDTVDLTITEENTGDVDLTDVYVDFYIDDAIQGDLLDETTLVSGDADTDGVLDVGETWMWEINGVAVSSDTNFEVLGFGTDPLGNVISYANDYMDEMDDVDVTTISPNTDVSITSSATEVLSGDTVDLTITEENTGDVDLTDVYVDFYIDDAIQGDLLDETTLVSGDADTDGVLDVGETWMWEINGVAVSSDTNFEVLGFGTDPLGNVISYANDYMNEMDDVDVTTISPNTDVSITSSATEVLSGDTVDLTITEENTGDVDLTDVYVDFYIDDAIQGDLLDETTLVSGDADTDGVLDVGETWMWEINGVAVSSDTNFEVLGFGTDPLGNVISYANDYMDEMDDVDVTTISPNTDVSITSSATEVLSGDTVDLTITEENTGDVDLTDVYVDFYIDDAIQGDLLDETTLVSGDADTDGVLDVGETWMWEINGVAVSSDTNFEVLGFGTDPLGNVISYANDYMNEMDDVDVTTISPNTDVSITSSATEVLSGDTVDLTITEENTGDVDLTDVYVDFYIDDAIQGDLLDETTLVSGDADTDGVLDVGETWMWEINGVAVSSDTNFEVLGFGTDPLGNVISYANDYMDEMDDVDVTTINPDTMVSVTAEQEGTAVDMVPMGDVVDLVITEQNTGDDPLTDVYVDVYKNGSMIANLDETSVEFTGGDDGNGVLDPGETWTWMITGVTIDEETIFEVYGFGTDSMGNVVSYENGYMDEMDATTVYLIPQRDETAWAYDPRNGEDATIDNGFSVPFTTIGLNNWGWTNGPYILDEEDFRLDIYAGAGNNIINEDRLVGHVNITFEAESIIVEYELFESNYLDEVHLYIGEQKLPMHKNGKYTNAPGQFPYDGKDGVFSNNDRTFTIELSYEELGLDSGDEFYIAAHSVVMMPGEMYEE